jgi:putative two-component system response regulator
MITTPGKRNNVLIVDDTPENIHLLLECLGDEYAASVATTGEHALILAAGDPPPDIILLDVMMPGMDGYEVCRRLKSSARTGSIPVIFVTAMNAEHDERMGLDLGAVDYIHKPFNPGLVKARIRNHLELKHHRNHLEQIVRERTHELDLTQDAAIYGLGILAEYRDPETGKHIKRTQNYMRILALHLKHHPRFSDYLDDQTIRLLHKSAAIHDIGKVGVSDSILLKPETLTSAEFTQMKLHTVYGRDTIERIEDGMRDESASAFLHLAQEITYTHHERWDGTGYHGLKGDAIPVSGRLMALADVYDALSSDRVYKPAYSPEYAFRIITQGDGRTEPEHFDPDVLQAFIDLRDEFQSISLAYRD